MVGVASRTDNSIQRTMPRITSRIRENGNQVDVLVGTDLVVAVTSGSEGNNPGDILVSQTISPTTISDTRMFQFSQLYQRYRFTRVTFIYEPIAPATQGGQVIGFCDFDADTIISTNETTNMNIAVAHQGQRINQVWEWGFYPMGQSPSFTDLYTNNDGDDPRLTLQGVFYLLSASVLPGSIPLGNIYVDYELELSIPNLSSTAIRSQLSSSYVASCSYTVASSPNPFQYSWGTPSVISQSGPMQVTTDVSGGQGFITLTGVPPDSSVVVHYSSGGLCGTGITASSTERQVLAPSATSGSDWTVVADHGTGMLFPTPSGMGVPSAFSAYTSATLLTTPTHLIGTPLGYSFTMPDSAMIPSATVPGLLTIYVTPNVSTASSRGKKEKAFKDLKTQVSNLQEQLSQLLARSVAPTPEHVYQLDQVQPQLSENRESPVVVRRLHQKVPLDRYVADHSPSAPRIPDVYRGRD
jgi:hypothetical protein